MKFPNALQGSCTWIMKVWSQFYEQLW